MIRQAAICLSRRWNASPLRAPPPKISGGSSHYPQNNVGAQRRLLASSSKSPPPPTQPKPAPAAASAPKDKAQEAIEKSERLHAELLEMVEAQKAAQAEENARPFGSNFISFMKSSKPEIVNIFFAFVCVLLAYQIHGMRAGIRKLQADKEEKDSEINRLRNILANMSEGELSQDEEENNTTYNNDSFAAKLAQKCADSVRTIFEQSEKRVGYSWILGKKLASGDTLEMEKLADELYPVILKDVQSAVGDAAFTAEELKERRVAALKEEVHDDDLSLQSSSSGLKKKKRGDAEMGELMEILDEVHNKDLSDERKDITGGEESTKVRRTRYAI